MSEEGEIVNRAIITEADLPNNLNVIERYDQARSDFILACADFSFSQSTEKEDTIKVCWLSLSKTFKESVTSIIQDEPDELSRAQQIANLAIGEHNELFGFIRRETGCTHNDNVGENMKSLPEEVYAVMLDVETSDNVVESFCDHVDELRDNDLSHFFEHVSDSAEKSAQSRPKRIAQRLGMMAIGASTIATGVAVGITITKLFD